MTSPQATPLTADAMKAIIDRLAPVIRAAMIEVAEAERWGQVPGGTTETLLSWLDSISVVGADA